MIIKSLSLWLFGYVIPSKMIIYFQNSILGNRIDLGLKKILCTTIFLFQISQISPYTFKVKDLYIPILIILILHIIVFLIKEFFHDTSSKFDTQFKLISGVVSTYNSPTIYGFSDTLKPDNIKEYIRVYLYYFALFILIGLFVLLHLTYKESLFKNFKPQATIYLFLGIVQLLIWIRILSKAKEYFTSEAFSKKVLIYFFLHLLQSFSLLIALVYCLKVIDEQGEVVYYSIVFSCLTFILLVMLPFLSDRKRVKTTDKENNEWLISELSFLKKNVANEKIEDKISNTLIQFKSRRDNIYDTKKYVRFFLYKINGLQNEIRFEEDFDKNEIKSHKKQVMFNTFIKADNERSELAVLRRSKDLIIPLKHFVYLDFLIKELETIEPIILHDKITEWIKKIKNEDSERFLNLIDVNSTLDKILLLLGKNDLKKAIEIIVSLDYMDNQIALQFKRRYQELKKKRILGIMSESDDTIQFNKLSFDIISFISDRKDKIK